MIARIWQGYTLKEKADSYESLLNTEIFHAIESKSIDGYRGIQLLRREVDEEAEFTTIMWFDSIDSVKKFAGENYEAAVVPEAARKLLLRFDQKSIHSEVKRDLRYDLEGPGVI
jgi:heme-degrading monooxygenase HmoA